MPCGEQQTILAASFSSLAFCCICCCSIWCWRNWYTPRDGKINLGNEEVNWRIIEHEGNMPGADNTQDGPGGEKIHIIWDLDQRQVQKYSAHTREHEMDNSVLGLDEMSIDGSEVDLSGQTNFSLATTVTTESSAFYLAGKENGDTTVGKNKALVILDGRLCWQVGDERLEGSKQINDGQQHDVEVRFRDNKYELLVDGQSDAVGLEPVADAVGATWVVGGEMENAYGEGETGDVVYNGQRVAGDRRDGMSSNLPITNVKKDLKKAEHHAAFPKGQRVEYFSSTHKQWVAAIVDSTDQDTPPKDGSPAVSLRVGAKDQIRHGVPLINVRLPFANGEAVSVYGVNDWYPARISGPQSTMATGKGYTVEFCDVDDELQVEENIQRGVSATRIRRRFEKQDTVQVYDSHNECWVAATVKALPKGLEPKPARKGTVSSLVRKSAFRNPQGSRQTKRGSDPRQSTVTRTTATSKTGKSTNTSWFGGRSMNTVKEDEEGMEEEEIDMGESGLPERWASVTVTLNDSEESREMEVPWYYVRSPPARRQ